MEKWFPAGLVLAGVIVAVLAFTMFQHMQAEEAPAIAAPAGPETASGSTPPTPAVQQSVSFAVLNEISPETRVVAERFRCVCGCPDVVAVCRCSQDPGGITMMNFLQGLVDRGLSVEEIDRAMVDKYGEEVLLFVPGQGTATPAGGGSPR
jgi:cytochrome c-type biogenesis protein CcmH/NrfF